MTNLQLIEILSNFSSEKKIELHCFGSCGEIIYEPDFYVSETPETIRFVIKEIDNIPK